jgi:hypothetical protein
MSLSLRTVIWRVTIAAPGQQVFLTGDFRGIRPAVEYVPITDNAHAMPVHMETLATAVRDLFPVSE